LATRKVKQIPTYPIDCACCIVFNWLKQTKLKLGQTKNNKTDHRALLKNNLKSCSLEEQFKVVWVRLSCCGALLLFLLCFKTKMQQNTITPHLLLEKK